MSDTRRVIETYIDVMRSKETDSDGNLLNDETRTRFFRSTQAIMRVHLKTDSDTTFKPPGTATWTFCIDNSFDPSHEDLVVTQDADFNKSIDWADVDVTDGKICFPVDTTTTRLRDAFVAENNPESLAQPVRAEIWMNVPGITSILVAQFKVFVDNIVCEIDNDTELESFSTTILRHVGDNVVLYFPDGSVAQEWTP